MSYKKPKTSVAHTNFSLYGFKAKDAWPDGGFAFHGTTDYRVRELEAIANTPGVVEDRRIENEVTVKTGKGLHNDYSMDCMLTSKHRLYNKSKNYTPVEIKNVITDSKRRMNEMKNRKEELYRLDTLSRQQYEKLTSNQGYVLLLIGSNSEHYIRRFWIKASKLQLIKVHRKK